MAVTLRDQLRHSLSGDQGIGMVGHVRFNVETGFTINPLSAAGCGGTEAP